MTGITSGRKNDRAVTKEVTNRMVVLRRKSRNRLNRILLSFGMLCFITLVTVTAAPDVFEVTRLKPIQVSSLTVAAGSSAGGYVLVGVLAFVLGVIATMVCLKWNKKKITTIKSNNKEKSIDRGY